MRDDHQDEIRIVDFTNTRVTDAGLVHLKGLTKLGYLHLAHTRITGAGLAVAVMVLSGACPTLTAGPPNLVANGGLETADPKHTDRPRGFRTGTDRQVVLRDDVDIAGPRQQAVCLGEDEGLVGAGLLADPGDGQAPDHLHHLAGLPGPGCRPGGEVGHSVFPAQSSGRSESRTGHAAGRSHRRRATDGLVGHRDRPGSGGWHLPAVGDRVVSLRALVQDPGRSDPIGRQAAALSLRPAGLVRQPVGRRGRVAGSPRSLPILCGPPAIPRHRRCSVRCHFRTRRPPATPSSRSCSPKTEPGSIRPPLESCSTERMSPREP